MIVFKWTTENVMMNPLLPGEYVKSPVFAVEPLKNFEFCLELYPRGCGLNQAGTSANLVLFRCDENQQTISLGYRVSAKNSKNETNVTKTFKHEFKKCGIQNHSFFISSKKTSLLLPRDTFAEGELNINCQILYYKIHSCNNCDREDLEDLSSSYATLLADGSLSDEVFKVGQEELYIYKALFATRCTCETFSDNLQNLLKQQSYSASEAGVSTLRMLFQFLYTGKLDYSSIPDELCILLQKLDSPLLKSFKIIYPITTYAITSFHIKRIFFEWSIENFMDVASKENFFIVTEGSTWSWIKCVFTTANNSRKDNLEIIIHRLDCTTNVFLRCTISIKQKNGSCVNVADYGHLFQSKADWIVPIDIKMSHMREQNIFFNGALKLLFNIHICNGEHVSKITATEFSQFSDLDFVYVKNLHDLADDFKRLLQTADLFDATLEVSDEIFPVHKIVLSARSPVFRCMFQHDTSEKQNGTVIIKDIKPEVVSLMLSYIYSGHVDELDLELALDLYYAANKYQITLLERKCSKFLGSILSAKNAGLILLHADCHNDQDLKNSVCKFVCSNSKQILQCTEWKEAIRDRADLTSEILEAVLKFLSEND